MLFNRSCNVDVGVSEQRRSRASNGTAGLVIQIVNKHQRQRSF